MCDSLLRFLSEFADVTLSWAYFVALSHLCGFKMLLELSQTILYLAVAASAYTLAHAVFINSSFKSVAQRLLLSIGLLVLCGAFLAFNPVVYNVLYEFTGGLVGATLSVIILRYKENTLTLLRLSAFSLYCLMLLICFWYTTWTLSTWFATLAESFMYYNNAQLHYAYFNDEMHCLCNILAMEKLQHFTEYFYYVNFTTLR